MCCWTRYRQLLEESVELQVVSGIPVSEGCGVEVHCVHRPAERVDQDISPRRRTALAVDLCGHVMGEAADGFVREAWACR